MKKKILHIPFILIGLLIYGCIDDTEPDDLRPVEKYQIMTEDYSFYADEEKYAETETRRMKEDFCQLDFQIQRVQRTDNELAIHTTKPKDCSVSYEIIWDGILMESFPMLANIFIRAIGEDCGTEVFETEVLKIDLEKTFKNMSSGDITNTDFRVRDACSLNNFQCSKDCDDPVSN